VRNIMNTIISCCMRTISIHIQCASAFLLWVNFMLSFIRWIGIFYLLLIVWTQLSILWLLFSYLMSLLFSEMILIKKLDIFNDIITFNIISYDLSNFLHIDVLRFVYYWYVFQIIYDFVSIYFWITRIVQGIKKLSLSISYINS
jgi:hypothetical protein